MGIKLSAPQCDVYFVLFSLLNGEEGMPAIPSGGGDDQPQHDGWYYLLPGNADGEGPFHSREEARREGNIALWAYLDEQDAGAR
jgi:hypothetical protein